MNNVDVQRSLDDCDTELAHVRTLIEALGASTAVPYLTKYAVIRACGSIETSFKSIIADHCSHRSKAQVKRFLDRRVREGSANPSYDRICTFLKDFDEQWLVAFKASVNAEANKSALLDSLQSLVDARNDFAHGGNPSSSIGDVLNYFANSRRVIELLDHVVC